MGSQITQRQVLSAPFGLIEDGFGAVIDQRLAGQITGEKRMGKTHLVVAVLGEHPAGGHLRQHAWFGSGHFRFAGFPAFPRLAFFVSGLVRFGRLERLDPLARLAWIEDRFYGQIDLQGEQLQRFSGRIGGRQAAYVRLDGVQRTRPAYVAREGRPGLKRQLEGRQVALVHIQPLVEQEGVNLFRAALSREVRGALHPGFHGQVASPELAPFVQEFAALF